MNTQVIERFPLGKSSSRIRIGVAAIAVVGILGVNSSAIAQPVKSYTILNPYTATTVKPAIPLQRAVYAAKFTCGIWDEGRNIGKTAAQVNKGIGAGPPLPWEHSTPPLLPSPPYYHDFQPGSYSTALNIFNPTLRDLNVNVSVSSESVSSPEIIATLNIASLNTVNVGCSDIERLLPAGFNGELVEGFFYIPRYIADILVQAVYSYSTMAAFQEFRGGFVDDFGVIPGEDIGFVNDISAGAGAGAGGLGLGGSVDIETIVPMMVGF